MISKIRFQILILEDKDSMKGEDLLQGKPYS